MSVRKFIQTVKAVDAAIMNKVAPDKPAGPPKIQEPLSTKCQMPTRAGGRPCLKPVLRNQDTCGSSKCAKAWADIHDETHSTHRHATNMRRAH